jgi:AcrR family transcriptional regulator
MPRTASTTRARAEHLGPERRRPQVLDTALQIAAEQGLTSVTMRGIASRMGVTRPVVYACFGSRGELLTALLDRESESTLSSLRAMLPPQRTGSIEQMFVDGFQILLTAVSERPAAWQIIFAADPDPVLTDAIAHGRAQVGVRVGAVMRPLLERWQVADLDEVLPPLAEVFLAISEAAIRMLLDTAQGWTPESLAEVMGRAAYRAMRATG